MTFSPRLLILPLFVALGCAHEPETVDDTPALNRWMVETYQANAIENAILEDRTLYPYHFVSGSEQLNQLGSARLDVLGNHFIRTGREHELNVRRGSTSDDLYHARRDAVVRRLGELGVEVSKVSLKDGLPGGDGAPSTDVRDTLTAQQEARAVRAAAAATTEEE